MKENQNNKLRTPLGVMMDMVKQEIGGHVLESMQKNQLPPGIMEYILKSILLDVSAMKADSLNKEYVHQQEEIVSKNEEGA